MMVITELAASDMETRAARESALLRTFEDELKRRVPGCRILAEGAPRLPGVTAVLLPGLASERAIAKLDLLGIQVSGGAACASREQGVSHVYRAMGLAEAESACVLRISIGRATAPEELQKAAEAIERVWRERDS